MSSRRRRADKPSEDQPSTTDQSATPTLSAREQRLLMLRQQMEQNREPPPNLITPPTGIAISADSPASTVMPQPTPIDIPLQVDATTLPQTSAVTSQHPSTFIEQESNNIISQDSEKSLERQSGITSSSQLTSVSSHHPPTVIERQESISTTYQEDNALSPQSTTAPIQERIERTVYQTDKGSQQQINSEAESRGATATSPQIIKATDLQPSVTSNEQESTSIAHQKDKILQQQINDETVSQNITAISPHHGITSNELSNVDLENNRDTAISRYRDETKISQITTSSIAQSATDPEQYPSRAIEEKHDNDGTQQHSSITVHSSTAASPQQRNNALEEQSEDIVTPESIAEVSLEGDDTAALESMLASVPEQAVAQLMQALLVQPKVNKLNSHAWRSGGMQVTHGTHKAYKLLAGQYGVHIRDIVEQSLKACLPIWRARLKQLRAEGVLEAEEAEEELDD